MNITSIIVCSLTPDKPDPNRGQYCNLQRSSNGELTLLESHFAFITLTIVMLTEIWIGTFLCLDHHHHQIMDVGTFGHVRSIPKCLFHAQLWFMFLWWYLVCCVRSPHLNHHHRGRHTTTIWWHHIILFSLLHSTWFGTTLASYVCLLRWSEAKNIFPPFKCVLYTRGWQP